MVQLIPLVVVSQLLHVPPQSPRDACARAAGKFVDAINRRDANILRGTFSEGFKASMDLKECEKLIDSIAGMRGKVTKSEFVRILGLSGYFDLKMESGDLALRITLDDAGSVVGLELEESAPLIPVPARNATPMSLPFRGEWSVQWGGDTVADNYHMRIDKNDWFAADFTVLDGDGRSHGGDGSVLGDFFAFGKDVLAAAPGLVVVAVDGVPDNVPGHFNPSSSSGNMVIVKHSEHEFSVYAHLRRGSVKVKEGDDVAMDQALAQCGNSGGATVPHLHFGLTNSDDLGIATGFQPFFRDVSVERDGKPAVMEEYTPKKADRIRRK